MELKAGEPQMRHYHRQLQVSADSSPCAPSFQKIRYYCFLNNCTKFRNLRLIFTLQGHQGFKARFTGMLMAHLVLAVWKKNIAKYPAYSFAEMQGLITLFPFIWYPCRSPGTKGLVCTHTFSPRALIQSKSIKFRAVYLLYKLFFSVTLNPMLSLNIISKSIDMPFLPQCIPLQKYKFIL